MTRINALLDARNLTDHRQNCVIEEEYKAKLNINSNKELKAFFMTKGNEVYTNQTVNVMNAINKK
jgi:hypothetical protein